MCYLKKCVSLLSLPAGTPVQHESYSNMGKYAIGLEKLCESGWIDKKLGICHEGFRSTSKGRPCDDSTVCETNLEGRTAECRQALLAGNENRYCDIEGNDNEWVVAKNAVILFVKVV